MISKTCPTCNTQYQPAPSKRLQTCPNCAHAAKYGETIFAKKWRKHAEKQRATPPKRYVIPSRSEKGKKKEAEIQAAKSKVKAQAKEGAFTQCGGCGGHFKSVDASHKVPVSQSSQLAASPENIRLLCRSCHEAWEHWRMPDLINLKCFLEDMEYLSRKDWPRFCRIYLLVLNYSAANPSQHIKTAFKSLTEMHNKKATP